MSRFNSIDDKLFMLAKRLNAKLTKDRPEYPQMFRTFEERRIDWADDGIFKAIIIQPTFEMTGVNSSIWNFINIAWYDDGHSLKRPMWEKILVEKMEFDVIEKNIDELITNSEENLKKIKLEDLK